MNFNRMDTAHRLRVDAKLFGGNANIVNSNETVLEPVSPASTTSRSLEVHYKTSILFVCFSHTYF